jgi:glycosyltransferase involved in cell wall biosynthesis
MAGLPSISIVIATYDRPRQLAACLDALSGLDYPRERFEVVVVDDGSPEPVATPAVDGLRLRVAHTPNRGPGAARNAGAALAEGELLAFIDDDCLPAPGWLRGLAEAHGARPQAALGGRTLNALASNPFAETTHLLNEVLYEADEREGWYFAANNLAVPAEGFRWIGGFQGAIVDQEDRDLCERWTGRGFELARAPGAVVYHAHDVTLPGFLAQHFEYGRGAHTLSSERTRRTGRPPRPEPGLHLAFVKRALQQGRRGPLLALLVLLSQAAFFAGFSSQRLRSGSPHSRPRSQAG